MICPSCSAANSERAKFCEQCGHVLARACPSCGAVPSEGARFCSECGTPVAGSPATTPVPAPGAPSLPATPEPTAERRLVTVLFADLVDFTSLSQSRDPEEVRDLLSRYFDTCSSFVERYGGVIEKFIGDAVMAVWGAPTTLEDDAERAVRAALDLVEAVAALGDELGLPGLSARAGVLTGEAAVNLGAKGQGMVAGDLVNTASRIQSVAESGTVLVGETTRRATEAAISYTDVGLRELKGKDEPVNLYHALRVVAGRGGLMKSEGLEPPFVGRERELKVVKELFHAASEGARAHLVQVTGIAGIGKSRLAWEFFKYMDGIKGGYFWHRGRCLAYGDGVTYWALAEMVRGRAGILEGEDRASAAEKLRAVVARYLADPEDRRFVEPRLRQLIGLEERASSDRQELFAAWRLFFERLAETNPVLMVFEDMQWADPSLLEFLEGLLEQSRNYPLFVMTLARPDTPAATFGFSRRSATSIYLDPLSSLEMVALLDGFAPGLPAELTAKILERAEGVPLYAVETVRMLLDRGLLSAEGAVYKPVGQIGSLEIPETLHALVAARLDGMSTAERRLVQDASVLGKSFTTQALATISGVEGELLDSLLSALVAKEILSVQMDPRSSERGQYGFLQDLTRTVAYETLARQDRKRKHLAAASYLEAAWGADEEEIVEVVASHLLQAYRLDEGAEDAPAIRDRARAMLLRAAERAASLAAGKEAQAYFEQAASLSESVLERAELTERAGQMAETRGQLEEAEERYTQSIQLFEEAGHGHAAARCQARLAGVEFLRVRGLQAIELMTRARAAMAGSEPDPDFARVTAQLGRFLTLNGQDAEAMPFIEEALELSEHLELPEIYAEALNNKALCLQHHGRLDESGVLLKRALEVALERDLSAAALRAYNNLMVNFQCHDRFLEVRELSDRARELARRVGQRSYELGFAVGAIGVALDAGEWDEALAAAREAEAAEESEMGRFRVGLLDLVVLSVRRGELDEARRVLDSLESLETGESPELRLAWAVTRIELLRAEGRSGDALALVDVVVSTRADLGLAYGNMKHGLVQGVEAALDLGEHAKVDELLGIVSSARPGEVTPWLRAQAARLSARVAAARWEGEAVEPGFAAAEAGFRSLRTPFDLGVALLEHAEWLSGQSRPDDAEPLVSEARGIFERLKARPWLERLDALRHAGAEL